MKILLVHKDCLACKSEIEKFREKYPDGKIIDISKEENKSFAKELIKKFNIKYVPYEVEV